MVGLPSLAALRAFEAVGRLRGIRRAAEELQTSHVVVSRHLQSLENQLGTGLFDREERSLTTVGAVYHQKIGHALSEISAATQAVLHSRKLPLHINCAPGLALHWLTTRLARLDQSKNAFFAVDLHTSDSFPHFTDDEVDGDIRYVPDTSSNKKIAGVSTVMLARPGFFPVATPELADRYRCLIKSASDLLKLPLIEERDDREWTHWFAGQKVEQPSFSRVARYGHAHLTLAAARAGQGIALSNPFLVADDLAAGRLVRLRIPSQELKSVRLGSYIFRTSKSKWEDERIIRFRRWLIREFAEAEKQFATAHED